MMTFFIVIDYFFSKFTPFIQNYLFTVFWGDGANEDFAPSQLLWARAWAAPRVYAYGYIDPYAFLF